MTVNEMLNYICENRSKKPNKNVINMFRIYLESCLQDRISMDQIMEEFNNGLTVEMFEGQVKEYLN